MKRLISTFGISGCGKSTYLKDKSPVIETDDIRKEMLGSVDKVDQEADVFKEAKRKILESFKTHDTVYFGSTMVETKYRLIFIQEIKDMCLLDIEFELIVFKSDPIVSKQRILNDLKNGIDRANSLEIIDKQYTFYKEALPLLDKENYSNIQYIGFDEER